MYFQKLLPLAFIAFFSCSTDITEAQEQKQGASLENVEKLAVPVTPEMQDKPEAQDKDVKSKYQQKQTSETAQNDDIDATIKEMDAAEALKAGFVADSIIVDKSDRTLILYMGSDIIGRYNNIRFGDAPNGHKQFQGDERTPEGVYYIDGRNPGSKFFLSLRISYPNKQDKAYARRKGRSPGGDIFIHGQPNGYKGIPISSDWTDGCVAVSNHNIWQIWQLVPNGTKITIQR